MLENISMNGFPTLQRIEYERNGEKLMIKWDLLYINRPVRLQRCKKGKP